MTYEQLWHRLTAIYEAGEAKAVARWVLEARFGLSWADILCGKVTQLSANSQTELEKITQRLEKAEPVQYVLGTAWFDGRPLHVAPGVLIPRPETEELCQWIAAEAEEGQPLSILDIGTGSGCIAITLALNVSGSSVSGWDVSADALRIARENAARLNAAVAFEERDILQPTTKAEQWDIIVSNPPYIMPHERESMARNVLDYEPSIALFAPEDCPTLFYERIGQYASQHLRHGGKLYFELNPQTAEAVSRHLAEYGFSSITIRQDQFGKQRFLKATKI